MHQRSLREDKIRLIRAFRNQDYHLLAEQLGMKRVKARKIVSRAMRMEDPEAIRDKR